MDEPQEKAGKNDWKPVGFGRKPKDRFMRRNKKKNDTEETENQAPKVEEPVSFNAHALDLEPGVVILPRPSLDLSYIDFTRESYEAGEKPFTPKKKKVVPFELSETPHMQTDYWEGKTPGRRKLMNAPDGAAAEAKEEPRRQSMAKNQASAGKDVEKKAEKSAEKNAERNAEKSVDKGAEKNAERNVEKNVVASDQKKGKVRDKRDDRRQKPEKDTLTKKFLSKKQGNEDIDISGNDDDRNRDSLKQQDRAKVGRNSKLRDQTVVQSAGKRQEKAFPRARDHRETRDEAGAEARAQGAVIREHTDVKALADKKGDTAMEGKPDGIKESLMRPYWMKKKR
jgi:hypothetical protein